MSNRILFLLLGAMLLCASDRTFATPITINFNQTMIGQMKMYSLVNPGKAARKSFVITVTNGTSKTWDDYEIAFKSAVGGVKSVLASFPNKSPFTTLAEAGGIVTLSGGNLPPTGTFTIDVTLLYNNPVTIWGQPSVNHVYAPEPSSLFLLGTGALGLLPKMRRKLRM